MAGVKPHPVVNNFTAHPSDARFLQGVDRLQNGGRVHPPAGSFPVIAISAPLGAGIRQGDLGVRRAKAISQEMLIDEPPIGGAVERRKVRMEDDVPADIADFEFPHIFVKKKVNRGFRPENARIRPNGMDEGGECSRHFNINSPLLVIRCTGPEV
jgi:hypothetical protein